MATGTTRFGSLAGSAFNQDARVAAALINGNPAYSGAPALDQDAQYPMTQLLNVDRYAVWKTSLVPASPLAVELDAGSNVSVRYAAIHGLRVVPGGVGPAFCDVFYRTAAQGYGTTWSTTAGSISLGSGVRDSGIVFASTVSARYWRFQFFGHAAPFSVGVIAVAAMTDLGIVSSSGYQDVSRKRIADEPALGGHLYRTRLGDDSRLFRIPLRNVVDSVRSTVDQQFNAANGLTFITPYGAFYQAVIRDGQLARELQFAAGSGADYWNEDLELETLA